MRPRHIGDADATTVVGEGSCERDFFPLIAPRFGDAHFTAKAIRVGDAERAFRAVNLNIRQIGAPYVEGHDERANRAIGELEQPGDVGRHFDFDERAILLLAGDGARREGDASRATDRRDGADEGRERGQIIRPHIEHGTAANLIIEFWVGMPAFVTVTHHESGRGDGFANRAGVDHITAGLQARAEESIGRAADAQAFLLSQCQQLLTVFAGDGERLFVIDALARVERRESDTGVGVGDGQVEDDLDFGIGQQFVGAYRLSGC